jgi:GTP cyclohydrolase IA
MSPRESSMNQVDHDKLLAAVRLLIEAGGDDPSREGLRETPERFLRAWKEWTSGYDENAMEVLKSFDDGAGGYDELVIVRDIPVYSLCEHHLAPFFGVAHIGYLPRERIVGLSKLNRLVGVLSRRLQVQERLTTQIADALQTALQPHGVAVMLECRHMCMESRGIRQPGAATITSAMRGTLIDDPRSRSEFLTLARPR